MHVQYNWHDSQKRFLWQPTNNASKKPVYYTLKKETSPCTFLIGTSISISFSCNCFLTKLIEYNAQH